MTKAYDLIVIGGGSGGVRAARMAATRGVKTALIEAGDMGGTCVNVGCIPKKLMTYAAHVPHMIEDAWAYGWDIAPPGFTWSRLIDHKNKEIKRLNAIYQSLCDKAGVDVFHGWGRLEGIDKVRAGDTLLTGKHILIATGGRPVRPDLPGAEHGIVSDDFFYLPDLPPRAAIIGGGYIAVEFASILHGLGADTSLFYRGDLFLRGFDLDVRRFLAKEMTASGQMGANGLDVQFNKAPQRLEKNGDTTRIIFEDGTHHDSDVVVFATGRAPATSDIGLETAGITVGRKGEIPVDETYRTNIPTIFALGDVIEKGNLTPVATAEAMAVVDHLTGEKPPLINYDLIATAVFTDPSIGTVGLSEEAAIKECPDGIDIYHSSFRPLKQTLIDDKGIEKRRVMLKLVVRQSDQRVLGVHLVAPDAGEIIQGFAVAVQMGATKKDFDRTIGIHPTLAEEFVTQRTLTRQIP